MFFCFRFYILFPTHLFFVLLLFPFTMHPLPLHPSLPTPYHPLHQYDPLTSLPFPSLPLFSHLSLTPSNYIFLYPSPFPLSLVSSNPIPTTPLLPDTPAHTHPRSPLPSPQPSPHHNHHHHTITTLSYMPPITYSVDIYIRTQKGIPMCVRVCMRVIGAHICDFVYILCRFPPLSVTVPFHYKISDCHQCSL